MLTAIGCMLAYFVSFGACSDNGDRPDGGGGDDPDTTDNVQVTVSPERTKMLRNPMTGWVLYSGIGDGLSTTFWKDYDNLPSTKGTIKVSDYATTLYIRGAWSDFNPQEGVYIWNEGVNTKPAQRFKELVDGARERSMKLAFTFVVDSRDKHYNFTPDYVKNAPGIEGYETTTGSVRVWSPYPDNPVFQQYYTKFIQEFAKTFNDPDIVQFVSGQGFGKWGEYHTVLYSTGDMTPREAVFDYGTELYANAFTKVPVIINYHRWIGTGKEWDGSNYDPDTERLLEKAISKGYSLRHDAFGMKTYYSTWERNFAASKRHKVPIIMEGGWVKTSHGGSIKGDGYADYADVRKGEYEEAKGAYVNMMDFRYNSDLVNSETFSWFNEAYALVEEFIAEGGYRLYPDRLTLPPSVKSGSKATITHRWLNLGWGYCPTNIQQWKDRFKVAFALLDTESLTPQYMFIDEEAEPSQWIKGTPTNYTFSPTISDVTAGKYMWAVGIVDTNKDNEIGILISAKEDHLTPEGWVKLTEVTVK